ncbi:MAG: RNHCP domain-containing protein [Microgenomates group bacterium]
MKEGKFLCENCHRQVFLKALGTAYRNHCPFCLWSKHADNQIAGDRKSRCGGLMEPLGLTFKHEGIDKFTNKPRQGEIMLVHRCLVCGKISINRIAGDDKPETILKVFKKSLKISPIFAKELEKSGIRLAKKQDKEEIISQLFGKI